MESYIQLLKNAIGTDERFSLQNKVFHAALLSSLTTFVLGAVVMLFQRSIDGAAYTSLMLAFYSIVYGYIYWLSRFKCKLQLALLFFSIAGCSLLSLGWLVDNGAQGSASYFFFIILMIIIFTADKPLRYVGALIANVIVLSIADESLREWITWNIPYSEYGQIGAFVTGLAYIATLAMFYKSLIQKKTDGAILNVIDKLHEETRTVNDNAYTAAKRGEDLLSLTLQQTTAVEELAATTEQLNATAVQNSSLTSAAMTEIKNTEESINDSQTSLEQMVSSIAEIKTSSTEIKNINSVIDEIAYQTNLLSLNAMIEASRSDDNGGFKVVALEVKKLAERSQQAAENINFLLNQNFDAVQQGANFAIEMQNHFQNMLEKLTPLVNRIQNIADASLEQREAIQQITTGLSEIAHTIESNKMLAEESSKNAAELDKNAESLMTVVDDLQVLTDQ